MNMKNYFILGCKLFGIYCLFLGIPALVATITTFQQPPDMPADIARLYFLSNTVIRISPILYIGAGLYLLIGGNGLYNLAYPENQAEQKEFEAKLTLFVKMLGIYITIIYLPELLSTISSYYTYSNAPPYYNLMQERQFAYSTAAENISGVILGLYLLRSGKFFIQLGLKNRKS